MIVLDNQLTIFREKTMITGSKGSWICDCGKINKAANKVCWSCKKRNGTWSWTCDCGQVNPSYQGHCQNCEPDKKVENEAV